MFGDLKHRIINFLLEDNEEIRNTEELTENTEAQHTEAEPITKTTKKAPKKQGRYKTKSNPIIYGENPRKGVIKHGANGYYFYFYDGKPHQKFGELDELKVMWKEFTDAGSKPELWREITGQHVHNKPKTENLYIHAKNGVYTIGKSVNGVQYTFGQYSTIEKARIVRDFLMYKEWDLQFLPAKILGKRKSVTDEYYLNMLPFMMDEDFEHWRALKNLGNGEYGG